MWIHHPPSTGQMYVLHSFCACTITYVLEHFTYTTHAHSWRTGSTIFDGVKTLDVMEEEEKKRTSKAKFFGALKQFFGAFLC